MERLDRDIKKKTDRIAEIAKVENPEQLLKRYISTIDNAISVMRQLRLELTRNLRGYQNANDSSQSRTQVRKNK